MGKRSITMSRIVSVALLMALSQGGAVNGASGDGIRCHGQGNEALRRIGVLSCPGPACEANEVTG